METKPEIPQDEIGKKLDLADSWLTKFGIILKKHWGKLLLLLFSYCVYWAFTQPAQTVEEPTQAVDTVYVGPDTYEEEFSSGDTVPE